MEALGEHRGAGTLARDVTIKVMDERKAVPAREALDSEVHAQIPEIEAHSSLSSLVPAIQGLLLLEETFSCVARLQLYQRPNL